MGGGGAGGGGGGGWGGGGGGGGGGGREGGSTLNLPLKQITLYLRHMTLNVLDDGNFCLVYGCSLGSLLCNTLK